uniref:Uncharacterized protein n=1 Tax=Megaselia scalaris TaxID=36166 RepID=T1GW55_MEGSC
MLVNGDSFDHEEQPQVTQDQRKKHRRSNKKSKKPMKRSSTDNNIVDVLNPKYSPVTNELFGPEGTYMPNSLDENNLVGEQNDTKGEVFAERAEKTRKKSKNSGRKTRVSNNTSNNNSSNAGVNLSDLN